jgi:hypothetical protein
MPPECEGVMTDIILLHTGKQFFQYILYFLSKLVLSLPKVLIAVQCLTEHLTFFYLRSVI